MLRVWSASLWNSTILPFLTFEVTLWHIDSGEAFSFQSSESTLDIKVIIANIHIMRYNQYNIKILSIWSVDI